jgi:hypothetical protein
MNGVPAGGRDVARTAYDMSPVEPLAIAMPLIELASGKGSFGREIEAKSGMEFANKLALGLYGFVMPPVVQKYGMRLAGPGGAELPMADIFDANGGQMTLPKHVTAGFMGLSMAGLTFLGAKTGLGASTAKAGAAALTAGIPGAMAGAEINTQRLMTDLGIKKDPFTNQSGDWTMDFFFNSFMGANRSWKVSASQAIANEGRRDARFAEMRNASNKEFMDAMRNGSESKAMSAMGAVYKLMHLEYADAELADKKFMDWAERQIKRLSWTPQFRNISSQMLESKIAAAKDMMRTSKSRFHRQRLSEMETERDQRRFSGAVNLKIQSP